MDKEELRKVLESTDEINKRLVYLCAFIVLVVMMYCGYREYLTYTNYEYPQINTTQTQTGISNVGGDE